MEASVIGCMGMLAVLGRPGWSLNHAQWRTWARPNDRRLRVTAGGSIPPLPIFLGGVENA
jgi:hypothetical protein